MRLTLSGLVVAFTAFAAGPLHAGETVSLNPVGVRLTLPEGFVAVPEVVQAPIVAAYKRPLVAGRHLPVMILVTRMGGQLGRETTLPAEVMALNPSATTFPETWKGFDILACRVPEEDEGVKLVTLNAQVPIRARGVQIGVFGEADQEAELRDLLRAVLATVDGETNWLTPQQRPEEFASPFLKLGLLFGAGVVLILVGRARRRREIAASPPPDSV